MAKNITAQFYVSFPLKTHAKIARVIQPLRWFNTYYKSSHEFDGGRIEVKTERALRDFPKLQENENSKAATEHRKPVKKHISFSCPYCKKSMWIYVDHINTNKGHLRCFECHKPFGVHPNGQMFVVRDVTFKEPVKIPNKDRLMNWLRYEAYYEDWDVEENREGNGVTVEVSAPNEEKLEQIKDQLRSEFGHRGLKFQEG